MTHPTESQVRRLDAMVEAWRVGHEDAALETPEIYRDAYHAVAFSLLTELDAARERVAELEAASNAHKRVISSWKEEEESWKERELALYKFAEWVERQTDGEDGFFNEVLYLRARAAMAGQLYPEHPKPTGAETPEVE